MQAQPKYSPDDTQPLAPLAALLADALAQRTALPEPGHGQGPTPRVSWLHTHRQPQIGRTVQETC